MIEEVYLDPLVQHLRPEFQPPPGWSPWPRRSRPPRKIRPHLYDVCIVEGPDLTVTRFLATRVPEAEADKIVSTHSWERLRYHMHSGEDAHKFPSGALRIGDTVTSNQKNPK